ncbi:MAG: methionine adenosyltransferase [Syntrophorhabdales bacterium]
MKKPFVFTSESVTEGHPDKLCDQISDAFVDHILRRDPRARIVAECAVSNAIVFIAARFDTPVSIDFPSIAREVIDQVGYTGSQFNSKTCTIITSLRDMPPEEYGRFDENTLTDKEIDRIVARNQVTVFGFACTQTPAFMPLPIWLAHKLARRLASVRFQKILPDLGPDGWTQVGVEYQGRRPSRIHSITVIANTTSKEMTLKRLQTALMEEVVTPVFASEAFKPDEETRIFINPDGLFYGGGPSVHSGLTGRKNAIDTYGEYSRHSGAALSGKDPLRIDRSGAYAARYAAKNVVAAGLAEECEVTLSYSIGLAQPVSIQIETFGTGRIPDDEIMARVERHLDFRPAAILRQFHLRYLPSTVRGGFYRRLASYGQVGRMDIGLPWEVTDKASLLQSG